MKKLSSIGLGLALVLGLTACASNNSKNESTDRSTPSTEKVETSSQKTIKVGLVGEKQEVWEEIKKRYEEKSGNKLELVVFTDYVQPNEALVSNDIDINAFQHKKYLQEYNKEHKTDLVSIGNTMLAPLGIYSNKIKDVKDLKEGSRVSIPNDPSNGSRALFLLQKAGLIKVKGQAGDSVTLDDISENKLNLDIVELDAAETPRSLDDVDVAVVNDNYALDAGFKPSEDAIFLEDPESKESDQYINIIATTKDKANDPVLKDLVENYYQTDQTKKDYEKYTFGAWIPAW
ncbi:MAG: MetQ/NlpA family ABC transporter substrate-binding protein [Peptoniphilaceae bacterium]|nr:MetQ/NlpA family ABC transporter substrate-binding protein [Peptoniphilaceae bacterium]MDY6019561.1 MetQ/NlpA family ABC transporter substrate-binding protein [Anaerococcus sp.]